MCCRHQSHSVYRLNSWIHPMRGRPPVRRLPADRRGDAAGLLSPFQSAPTLDLPGSTGGQCFPPLVCARIPGKWR
ncbi:Uncharacterised protein [Shigella sonnei]|nr:Uncharacterised protein [Shigella sonnei]